MTGTNFIKDATTINVDEMTVSLVNVESSTKITAYIKSTDTATKGLKDVKVTTTSGTSNPVSFQLPELGTTIITHGFQPGGGFPNWVPQMGAEILKKAGRGRLWRFDAETDTIDDMTKSDWMQGFPASSITNDGEQIVLVNWGGVSNNPAPGFAEATAHAVYSLLMGGAPVMENSTPTKAPPKEFYSRPLHFIAHSFGTVVNSEVIRRLEELQDGKVPVDQMTTLDPHDFDEGLIVDSAARMPNVKKRSIVTFADNYYEICCGGTMLNPHGHGLNDVLNYHLTELPGFRRNADGSYTGGADPHARTHTFYLGTFRNTIFHDADNYLIPDDWYGDSEELSLFKRTKIGFTHSRLGGMKGRASAAGCTLIEKYSSGVTTNCDYSDPYDVIIDNPAKPFLNGTFQAKVGSQFRVPGYVNIPDLLTFPEDSTNRVASLNLTQPVMESHIQYVPPETKSLAVKVFGNPAILLSGNDKLQFSFKKTESGFKEGTEQPIGPPIFLVDHRQQFDRLLLDMSAFKGQSGRLGAALITTGVNTQIDGQGPIASSVYIDDIEFSPEDPDPTSSENPFVSLQMTQQTYSDGDTVALSEFRIRNPRATSVTVRIEIWVLVPLPGGSGKFWLVDTEVTLPANLNADLRDFFKIPVTSFFPPKGAWQFNGRLTDPKTGILFSPEDINNFEIR